MSSRQLLARSAFLIVVGLMTFTEEPLRAQSTGAELDELKRAIDAGQPVTFRFKFNSMAADSAKSSGIYACCGMPAVYMADGTVLLTSTAITFKFSTAVSDFTVPPDKIVDFTSQPGSRVQLTVMVPNKKGKEVKKTYYLYNPAAVGSGDPSVGGPGASISCFGCDRSMDTLAKLVAWIRTPDRAAAPAPPKTTEPAKVGMTNEDVIKLAAAGLSEQVIATAIRQESVTNFDLSASALIALKGARVPDGAIAAMQEKKSAKTTGSPDQTRPSSSDGTVAAKQETGSSTRPSNPCSGLEMMGLYKVDMRPASPLVVYQAKVRNGTSVTRIVTVGWQDYYGVEKQVTGQVSPGDIATFNLGPQEQRDRQPINLRVKSCE